MSTSASSVDKNSSNGWIKLITNDEVNKVLTWEVLIPAIRRALVAVSQGPNHPDGAIQPLRSFMPLPKQQGGMLLMPGLVNDEALAVKILTFLPRNSDHGHNTHSSNILLLHEDTGLPAAFLQGEVITALRTAASSAVATHELLKVKGGCSSWTVAVLGAGVQAASHARAMAHILKLKKIIVWARRTEAAEELCSTLRAEGIPAGTAHTVEEAVKEADVINSCTGTTSPILKFEWIKPGAHINSVGAPRPDQQEMEENLVHASTIYTDSYEAAYKESGDVIKSKATVFAEIGEVILGKKPVLHEKTTIYKSLGIGVLDAVAAQIVYNQLMV